MDKYQNLLYFVMILMKEKPKIRLIKYMDALK